VGSSDSHSAPAGPAGPARSAPTLIRLDGPDALGLLHRLATPFLEDLASGGARMAPFCDFRGRLLHRAAVARTRDGALWLIRDDAPGDTLAAFIERHVFRERVRVEDQSARFAVRGIPDASGLAAGTAEERDGAPVRVQPVADFGYAIDAAPGAAAAEDAEPRRVRMGWPRHGHEIAEAFTPFEIGIAHEVHLAKGCFTGQEALLRLVTYDAVRRRLARIGAAGAPPAIPAEVRAADERVGVLTSVAPDGAGGWIGLAVLAHAACGGEARLTIDGAGAVSAPDTFALTRPLGWP
jgi:folate-binding protein YgfZ